MLSPEKFCDDVKAALIEFLPAELAAQSASWAAADAAATPARVITLDMPRAEDIYIGGAPGSVIRYPAIEIAVPDMGMSAFSLENIDADATPKLMVRALFQLARDPEWLYRMGCRWFAATLTVLANPATFPEMAIDGLSGHWRNNPQTGEADQVQSGVLMSFDLAGPLSPFLT